MPPAKLATAKAPRTWDELIPAEAWVRIVLVALLLGFTYWSAIRGQLVNKWITDGNWSHGWLIPAFSVYLIIAQRDALFRAKLIPNYAGAVVLVAAIAMYFFFGWIKPFAYLRTISLVGAIYGLVLLFGGWGLIRVVWFPIAFLLLAVPLPQHQYAQFTLPLRMWASSASAAIMPLFASDLFTEAHGVVIEYQYGAVHDQLNVEEACSGMRLIMAFTAIGMAMAYLGRRPLWQRVIMVGAILPIAILCNTIRVTTTGLLVVFEHRDLATGTPHALLGILMLVLALGLFALIGYVLSHLFVEETDDPEPTDPAPA